MKIRHIKTQDIAFCSKALGCNEKDLFGSLARPKPLFERPLFYVVYDEHSGKNKGAFSFSSIDYKNKHLVLLASERSPEFVKLAADHAFCQLNMKKVYLFVSSKIEGLKTEGFLRSFPQGVYVFSLEP
ncbi:MAG: hypothetical protein WC490_04810 [Candidatus Margulisiibacteriota bacterium]